MRCNRKCRYIAYIMCIALALSLSGCAKVEKQVASADVERTEKKVNVKEEKESSKEATDKIVNASEVKMISDQN